MAHLFTGAIDNLIGFTTHAAVAFDTYQDNSLQNATRAHRKGARSHAEYAVSDTDIRNATM